MTQGLGSKIFNKLKQLVSPPQDEKEDKRLTQLMAQSVVWATAEHADILGASASLSDWESQWVLHHVLRESLADKVIVVLGPSPSAPVIAQIGDLVRHVYLLDADGSPKPMTRGTHWPCDLTRPLPLPDASVDLVISTNGLDRLSTESQHLQAREIDRILRPGGRAFFTLAYDFDRGANEPLNVAAMLETMPHLRLLGVFDSAMLPGSPEFDETRVRSIRRLLTGSADDSTSAARLGLALEKPPRDDIPTAQRASQQACAAIQTPEADPRLARLFAACPDVRGKQILVLWDTTDTFSASLETAGAVVHSCVPDMAAYESLKAAHPNRPAWIHDLERPWNLVIGSRYDLVVAFDVLHRLRDPKPLLSYMIQLAPMFVIDGPVLDSDAETIRPVEAAEAPTFTNDPARTVASRTWLVETLRRLDVEVHDLSSAIEDEAYAWSPKNDGACVRHGRILRGLFVGRRRRDEITPIIVHVHLPKTGGQSVNEYLTKTFQDRMVHFYKEKSMLGRWDVFGDNMNERPDPLVFSAHVMRMHFPPILGGRLALYIAFFRRPHDTLFSYIKYIKKSYDILTPPHKKVLPPNCKSMSVEALMKWYLRTSQPVHFAGHILPVHFLTNMNDLDRAKKLAERFHVIGITEQMPRSIALLRAKLAPYGFQLQDVEWEKKNVTSGLDLDGYDPKKDEEFLSFVQNKLANELMFYDWACERFEAEAAQYGI